MQSIAQLTTEIKAQFGTILNGRIENAARLIEAGAVTRLDDYNWTVQSQGEAGKSYTVTFKMAWQCDCKDFIGDGFYPAPAVEFMGSVGPVCKHIVASGICWASGEYPSPRPPYGDSQGSQAPLYDLAISCRKRPFTTGSEDYLILWYKRAGEVAVHPKGKKLTDSDIKKALGRYTLVHTEALAGMVVRRYNLFLTHEVQL